eukprot:Blabericola_migrator_1__7990@NODE_40_length_17295_cov_124_751393_g36_i0_p11_GENE_NODE_40_length_17295_cov_124_751393_g36_i0NODE_40_length_17295_cov_124_751393_g36_i0_p11_ORF_typecomplete_len167_score9_98_NODE_40_length_17295_cov_124_751393_g36_i01268813188
MKSLRILLFCAPVCGHDFRTLRLFGREPDVGLLRLPPPHLRVSYFYPTTFDQEKNALPPIPPPNPAPLPLWFPPLSNRFTGPAFDYQDELLTALEYPFLFNPPASDGDHQATGPAPQGQAAATQGQSATTPSSTALPSSAGQSAPSTVLPTTPPSSRVQLPPSAVH